MPFIEQSTAPPFIMFQSSANGLPLRTRSATAARAKIDGLLACTEDITLDDATLYVVEPCARTLVEAFKGPVDKNRVYSLGGFPHDDAEQIVERVGHQRDSLATEAWERLGAPRYTGFRQDREGEFHIIWTWERENGVPAETFEAWHEFLVKHDALQHSATAMRVEIHAGWSFRFRSKSGGVAGDPYPRSRLRAYLAGRRPYARMQIVLPYAEANAAFRADHKLLNKALQLELPLQGFKLTRPPKKPGGQRSFRKLS